MKPEMSSEVKIPFGNGNGASKAGGRSTFSSRNGGFTLVELLGAVFIVLILAVLVVQGAKQLIDRAKTTKCVSNLRTYASQAIAYAADNGGAIPILDKEGRYFQRVLPEYPDNYSIYPKLLCPSYVQKRKSEGKFEASGLLTIWWTGYNGNRYFADSSGVAGSEKKNNYLSPGRLTQIQNPSKTPLYFDNNTDDPLAGDAGGGYAEDGKGPWHYAFWKAHQGGFNIAFIDGHVEWVKFNGDESGGDTEKGKGARDYPQFSWKPY